MFPLWKRIIPREFQNTAHPRKYTLRLVHSTCHPDSAQVQEELGRMESMGVISRTDKPTPWCLGMVVVPQKSGAVRICVDFRRLNESVLRETHPLSKVDITLAQLRAKVFNQTRRKQRVLADSAGRELTTFITPFGRYHFNRMPFGISSAPEHFQRQMEKILAGQKGILCHMDDVLVFWTTQADTTVASRQSSTRSKKQASPSTGRSANSTGTASRS